MTSGQFYHQAGERQLQETTVKKGCEEYSNSWKHVQPPNAISKTEFFSTTNYSINEITIHDKKKIDASRFN